MANTERENPLGFVDRRSVAGQTSMPGNVDTDARYLSVASLRTALSAAAPTSYTTARLERMTKNDMVYALRLIDDAAGI